MLDSSRHAPSIGPSSDGGLLVQNVHNNQAVEVNLADFPSSKVRLPSFVSHLHAYSQTSYGCRIKIFHWEYFIQPLTHFLLLFEYAGNSQRLPQLSDPLLWLLWRSFAGEILLLEC